MNSVSAVDRLAGAGDRLAGRARVDDLAVAHDADREPGQADSAAIDVVEDGVDGSFCRPTIVRRARDAHAALQPSRGEQTRHGRRSSRQQNEERRQARACGRKDRPGIRSPASASAARSAATDSRCRCRSRSCRCGIEPQEVLVHLVIALLVEQVVDRELDAAGRRAENECRNVTFAPRSKIHGVRPSSRARRSSYCAGRPAVRR